MSKDNDIAPEVEKGADIDFRALREVEASSLRRGDRIIAIPRHLEVAERVVSGISKYEEDVETDGDFYHPDDYRFLLVKVAPQIAPLPDWGGAVISVDGAKYMRMSTGVWVSEGAAFLKVPDLLERIEATGGTFRVVAGDE